MKRVVLSEIITELESGSRPKGGVSSESGQIPSLGAEHLDGNGGICFDKVKLIEESFFESMNRGRISKDDVLLVKDGATTGKASFVDQRFIFKKAAINEHVFRIKVNNSKAVPKYLFYFLFSDFGKRQVLTDFRGATIGGISQNFVNKVSIPLPELAEQKRIVCILDQADSLRQKRKEQIKLLDDFLKSKFLEMFGELSESNNRCKHGKICNFVKNINNENTTRYPDKLYHYIDIASVNNIEKRITGSKPINGVSAPDRARQLVEPGDILVSTVRPNLNAVALIPKGLINPIASTGFCVLRARKEVISNLYLFEITKTKYFVGNLVRIAKGANYPSVSDADIKNMIIPVPPLSEQERFSKIIARTEMIKEKLVQNSEEMNNQFTALMQEYFG